MRARFVWLTKSADCFTGQLWVDDSCHGCTLYLAEPGNLALHIDGKATFYIKDEKWQHIFPRATNHLGEDEWMRAPIPGKVTKVFVTPGESVEKNKPILVLEAMKMENELKCPLSGTVDEIRVAAGDAVESAALLVKFKLHQAAETKEE